MAEKTWLYRIYDASDNLLYVGISNSPAYRWQSHEKLKPWWEHAAAIKVEMYEDRRSALDAELAAIRAEFPRHNTMGVQRPVYAPAFTPQQTWDMLYESRYGKPWSETYAGPERRDLATRP